MLYDRGQQAGKWQILRYDQMINLGSHYQVQVTLHCEGREYTSSSHTALKHARQLAIADALAMIAGVVLPPEAPVLEPWQQLLHLRRSQEPHA